jgi:hypothetical protein
VANNAACLRPGRRVQLDLGDVVHFDLPGADPGDLAGAVQRLDQAGAGDTVGFGAQQLQLGEAGLVGNLEQGAQRVPHPVRDALGHHLVQAGVLRLAHPTHQAGKHGQAGQQDLVFEQVEHGPVEQRLGSFLAGPHPGREIGAQVLLPSGELAVAEGVTDLPGVLVGGLSPGAVLLQAARVDVELVGDEGHRAFGDPGGVVGLEDPEHAHGAPLHGPPQPGGRGAFARGQLQGVGGKAEELFQVARRQLGGEAAVAGDLVFGEVLMRHGHERRGREQGKSVPSPNRRPGHGPTAKSCSNPPQPP